MLVGRKRDKMGRYSPSIEKWTYEHWDAGYIDSGGRMRVYRPDCPKAYRGGYALRAHVVWWIETGSLPPKGVHIHHKDHNCLNDKFENLELLDHKTHLRKHFKTEENTIQCVCSRCGKSFTRQAWRLKANNAKNLYCSRSCVHG